MEIIVKVTDNCNFACNYCSVGDPVKTQIIKMDTIKKMIDGLPELLNNLEDKDISILWHGGEPLLLSMEFYREAMNYAKAQLIGYNLSFKMQSNGYLLNKAWIELLQEYQVNIGISLDGYQELHDANRRTKTGEPTFEIIMQNIELLRQANMGPGVLMVLNTAEVIDVDKLFSFILEYDLSCKIHAVYPSGKAEQRQDIVPVYQSYIDLMKILYRKMMECDIDISIAPLTDMIEAIITDNCMSECSYAGNCGYDFICLFEDGGVSFCGRNSNDFGLGYGNIHEKSLYNLYNSDNAKKIRSRQKLLRETVCAGCEDYELCHGGCAFETALANGSIDHGYPHCKQWQELIAFVRNEGLHLLRERLLRTKQRHKEQMELNTLLLEVLNDSEL